MKFYEFKKGKKKNLFNLPTHYMIYSIPNTHTKYKN